MNVSFHKSGYARQRARLLSAVYRGDPNYRPSLEFTMRTVLNEKSAFARGADVVPVTVAARGGEPLVSALFVRASLCRDTLQVAFFEAVPRREDAVAFLIAEARAVARRLGVKRIVVGMNGHVNHGLGLLAGPFDRPATFGSSYNPPYYLDYLRPFADREVRMSSYTYNIDATESIAQEDALERLSRRYVFRMANFRNLSGEIAIYTDLNNLCFASHPFYFERRPGEDLELFLPFRSFLKEENLLIAERDGVPVGFLLWYPDFHELTPSGSGIGWRTLLRFRLLRQRVSTARVAELGVAPSCQDQGVAVGLIASFHRRVWGRFSTCESGWIMDSNAPSLTLCKRWGARPGKVFAVFEIGAEGP